MSRREDAEVAAELRVLGHLLVEAARRDGRAAAQRVVKRATHVLERLAPGDPAVVDVLVRRSAAYLLVFRSGGGEADLHDAVRSARDALRVAGHGDPRRAELVLGLAGALQQCYEVFGDLGALDEAVVLCRSVERSGALRHLLAECLRLRYERTGAPRDIEAALRELKGPGDPADQADPRPLSGRSVAHLARYRRTGDERDLARAVTWSRRALDVSSPAHPDRGETLARLSLALEARYERTLDPRDLDEAVERAAEAVAAVRADNPWHARYLYGLGLALRTRYDLGGDPEDLDRAIAVARRGLALRLRGPARVSLLHHLSGCLRLRAAHGQDARDLAEAQRLADRAVDAAGDDTDVRAAMLAAAAGTLLARRADRAEPHLLREAVARYEEARRLIGPRHPARAVILLDLGAALERGGTPATAVYREAARLADAATCVRLRAARAWGESAVRQRDWPEALRAFSTAVELLPRLAGIALPRPDQRAQLAAQSGLAATAAAVALHAGQPGTAAVLLEQGRAVLFQQHGLDACGDVAELRERDEELAARFERLCRALDPGPRPPAGDPGPQAVDEGRHRSAEWEELLTSIRGLPGLASFLRPLSVPELQAAAVDGPLVLLNVSPLRSDALLVRRPGTDIEVVPLPDSLAAGVEHHVAALTGEASAAVRGERIGAALAFLREAVVERVLARLAPERARDGELPGGGELPGDGELPGNGEPPEGREVPGDGELPRVWWVPGGPAALLPFHACALDRVVSSYTATVRALLRGREAGGPVSGRALAVGVPVPEEELAHVAREIELVRDGLGGGVRTLCGPVYGPAATAERVRAELPGTTLAHFACPAEGRLADPAAGRLRLLEGDLPVGEIASMRLRGAHLAYLSAAATASGGTRPADEGVSLCAAFQLAGFRHVVGTLWPAGDQAAACAAPCAAASVYAELRADPHRVARAVHRASVRARAEHPGEPLRWAALVHTGP
ncbi:CHAT domain-containing protein [Streptomyces sp. NPDC090022]|uniref:CHAT domain-containing protein n=1 Tax=Streptomyces sp. NPDC090022 TaxID=3365920 RepID=UPI0038166AE9